MRKFYFFLIGIFLCTGFACGAGRVQNTNTKKESQPMSTRQQTATKNTIVSRTTAIRTTNPAQNSTTNKKTTARTGASRTVSARTATPSRAATARSMIAPRKIARAGISNTTNTGFGENYNSCRETYFTCMDQFCATQNDAYRRCVCSSRLSEIIAQEKRLTQTADNLEDFQTFNIDAISKTADEVKSMVTMSDGETGIKKDTSSSAKTLNNISNLLETSKKKSLSTSGTLDIAGNIKNIWTTTNLIGGTDIANLTGESLYNAVHTQCAEIVSQNCSASDLKMVTSTYGMYIENDCALLSANIEKQTVVANSAIRTTRHQMQDARLENYNAHNSLSVNDCIVRVRQDITAPTACGDDFVRCLDFSGKYLNLNTGEPIYSSDFYQLEKQLSLNGDILNNEKNAKFIQMLDKKRTFAQKSLDLCTNDSDAVWNEFLRQAIVEIYQSQQQRVQDVKSECLQVVNECYLKQSDSLKSFSNNSSMISLGHTLELSEELCATKLNTCSNLYGGGSEGLSVLVNTMHNITNETIAQECSAMLNTFVERVCAVPSNDSGHSYPYGCRVYAPGESKYANKALCNSTLINPFTKSDILPTEPKDPTVYMCTNGIKRYTQCNFNYYLYNADVSDGADCGGTDFYDASTQYCKNKAKECRMCPTGYVCIGGTNAPENMDTNLYETCGPHYIGSLYQQMVRFALQNCTRPSDDSYVLSESLLADVNVVMQTLKTKLVSELSSECVKYNGTWIDIPWIDEDGNGYHDMTNDTLLRDFYTNTGTNKLWGYCK